ncbi:MAG: SMP-30/gluconolactonase/LRE family protein [Candidatus Promineofilum sp.]|nr:SMP-30/gluconolactonase/LRE family protein [Promineifilum sp.]
MTPKLLSTHAGRQPARLIFALLVAAVLLLAQQPTPANAYPLWTSTTVAAHGDRAEANYPLDLKFDAGGAPYLAIGRAYSLTDVTKRGLLLAEWDGSAWRTSQADPRVYCIDYPISTLSLAVNADGSRAAFSYFDVCEDKFAVTSGSKNSEGIWSWQTSYVPYSPEMDPHFPQIYLPSAIAFDSLGNMNLVFAADLQVVFTRQTADGWTEPEAVTSRRDIVWQDVSIVIDAGGRRHVAYDYGSGSAYDITGYAYQNNLTGEWIRESVVLAGGGHSLAVDSRGQARIAFHDSRARSLKYAERTGLNAWTITTIDTPELGDTLSHAGLYPSLTFDAADNPHVAYTNAFSSGSTLGVVRYAVYDGATWQKEWVEWVSNYKVTVLALDNAATPHISYTTDEEVRYASRGDATGTPPPDTIIDSSPARVNKDTPVTFTFHSDDPAATFECRDTSDSFVACTSPHTWAVSSGGGYTFWVRAVSAGQADPSPAFYNFTWDTTPPDSRVVSGPSQPTSDSPNATFNFTANEAATFRCLIRLWRDIPPGYVQPVMQPCTSPMSFTGLDDGGWVFEVMATDAFGNAEAYENAALYYWIIDQIGPPTTITGGKPAAVTTSTTASFTFSSSDASYTFECQLDGGLFAACASPQSYSNLADGSHTFQVRAIDGAEFADPTPAGHTWTIDTVVPDTTLTGKPYNPSRSNSATFTFSSGEAGAMFECQLDSGDFAACASPQSYSNLADGSHTFSVRAKDAAGNVDPSPAAYTWTIDTVVPDTTIDAYPPNPSTSSSATFAFSSTEAGATFACKLDSADYGPCTSPKTYNGLSDGSHTFTVRAGDAAGNLDPTPAVYTWTLDATPPETTITAKPAALSNDPTPDFAFTSSEGNYAAGIYFYCQTDANAWVSCGGDSITYFNLFDGDHTFRVKAEDTLGNVDPTPATWSWTMDLTAPETTITAKPAAATSSTNATFEFTSSEAGTFECKLDSGSYAACASPKSYTGLSEASHTFQARATDTAGNVGSPAGYTWTIDTTPPDTTITAHPDALTNSATAAFSFTGVGAESFECKLDSAGYVACASPVNYTNLYNGSHTFYVRAKDAAGNYDPSSASYTWTVDTNPPETTITQWPATPSVGNTAVFTFSSETGATFECRLDGAAFATCTSPQNYTGLSDGSHTFQVRAKDAAGNVDPSPAGYTWAVDTTPPETTITGKPAATTNSTTAEFTFSGGDAASFECKLDSGSFAVCTSPKSYTGLTDGDHTFFVRAKDTEGRYDPSPASYTWTVDTNPPETTLTGQPPATTNSTTAEFTFTGVDAASFECKLDTAAFAACVSPKSYTNLSQGSHTFEARAKDAAGNVDPSPAAYTWAVDTTPPETTIDFTAVLPGSIHFTVHFTEPVNGFANGDVVLSGTAGATTAIVTNLHDRMEFDLDVSGMTGDGTIIIAIAAGVATDAAGNGNTAATLTWTIETPGPDTSLDSYPPNPSNSATAGFTFSGAGAASFECSLDDAPFAECVSPHEVTNLADGPHFFAVRAVDDQGKADTDYPIHFWIVDTTSPETTIDFTAVLPGSIHFTVHFTEPVNGFANGDVVLSGTAGATTAIVTNLHDRMEFDLDVSGMTGDGTIIIAIAASVATDAAGNGNTAATLTWTIDTTGPAVTITGAPPDPSDSAGAVFIFSSDDATATFACSLDGADFAACASPKSYTGLADGDHTFHVQATDAAGNTGDPAGHTWTIATTSSTSLTVIKETDPAGGTGFPFTLGPNQINFVTQWGSEGSGDGQFYYPLGVAVDAAGNVYVADAYNYRIQKFNSAGGYLAQWSGEGDGNGQFGDLDGPRGVAVDAAGNVYVADTDNHRIQKFDGDGNYLLQWGGRGSGNGQFIVPTSVAVDGAGNVYVADSDNDRIQKFDGDGDYLAQWGGAGSGDGQFAFPYGVAVDAAGNVYVSDSENHRIQKFDGNGNYLDQWGGEGDGNSQFDSDGGPLGVAVDGAGNVYVVDTYNHRIQRFDGDGNYLDKWGQYGSGNGQFLFPYGVTVDGADTVYVADSGNQRIKKFVVPRRALLDDGESYTFDGLLPGMHLVSEQVPVNWSLDDITCDGGSPVENGNGVSVTLALGDDVTCTFNNTYALDTTPPQTTIASGPATKTNDNDPSFTFSSNETSSTFECRLDSGAWQACNSPKSYTDVADGEHTFQVRATDPAGNTGAADSHTWTIDTTPPALTIVKATDPAGGTDFPFALDLSRAPLVAKWGEYGRGNGQFAYPNDVAVDRAGNVYVADSDNSRIQKFDGDGNYLAQWGEFGQGNGQFDYPNGVAVDAAGNVYVTDSNNYRIQKFDGDGDYLAQWGEYGSGDGQFAYPNAIAVDTAGHVYVVDADNGRIQKFDSDGHYLAQWGEFGQGNGQFDYPNGVAVDAAGNVYVTDANLHRIQKFDGDGHYLAQWGQYGSGNGQFSSPGGLVVDAAGNVYVADSLNDRIQKFDGNGDYLGQWGSEGSGAGQFAYPRGVAVNGAGNVYVVDTDNYRIQKFTFQESAVLDDGESQTFSPLTPGTVLVSELAPANWTLAGIDCDGGNPVENGNSVEVTLALGNDVTCTFSNVLLDTTPPETTITSVIFDVYTVGTITIEFSSSEANSTFACQLDGGGWAACVSPVTYNALADGPHTFEVRATDAAGNTDPSPATATWTVQTPGPDTSLDSTPPDPSTSTTATFTFSSAEATQFECSLDAADFAACTSPHVVTGLADGLHFFLVRAVNAQGRVDDTPAEHWWFVDATPPAVTINQAATQADPTNAGPIHFTVLFSEPVNDFTNADVTLGGTAGATTAAVANLHDHMEYDVAVSGMTGNGTVLATIAANVAHDAAGNGNAASTSTDSTVTYIGFDTTPPETTLTAAPDNLTNNNDPSFSFSSNEPGSSFTCQLDGGTATTCASPQSYIDLADGSHTFTVFATDAAGNADPSSASHTWTIDTTGPDTTINSGPSGITGDNDPSFGFSSEAGAAFECRLDSGAWASCASPKGYTNLADGPHTFRVRATDAAGNTGPTAERAFTVDSAAPSVSIDTHPPALTNNNDPTFTFSGETGAALACKLDGGAFAPCDSPKSYTDLADGEHTFKVRATDSAGNSAEAAYTWTIDTTPPATTITAAPPDPSSSPDASFTFTSESGAAFECRLDGGLWGMCASPRFYAGLSEGSHTFEVRASDLAGNTGPADSHTWTIDLPAPFALYVTASGGRITNGPTYQKNDILKWDGAAWSVWFDGASKGLPANADIIAFDVDNDAAGSAWVVIRQATKLPGVGKMQPNEIAYYNGSTWSRFFDGGDVGLKTSGEHINGLEVLPGSVSPIGNGCQYYLLISTVAGGGVPIGNTNVNFTGEDVLGFCMTQGGANTAGAWRMVFEGQSEGLQKNNNYGLSSSDDASILYFTAKSNFTGDGGLVKPSEVFSFSGGVFSGPLWKAKDHGLMQVVDGIDVVGLFQ